MNTPISPREAALAEAAQWALEHFYHQDIANAKIHCAPVKFSPITFRLASALGPVDDAVEEVLTHREMYAEDPGR